MKSLKTKGKAAIILPHGVLFRGSTEAAIRKRIIDQGFIKGIISLPANLFYGTGIPACILIIDKEDASHREGIFMIDASKGFVKDGSKNRLREQDIQKIGTTLIQRDVSDHKYARFVPNDEIKAANEYNLNIPRYIDSGEPEDLQDINAHLNGGIPAVDVESMAAYWAVYPSMKKILFKSLRKGYYLPALAKENVVSTITSQDEFIRHANLVDETYSKWKGGVTPLLLSLTRKHQPKEVIAYISERLLTAFSDVPLLNRYDVYQVLMEYWEGTMQDDVYAVCFGGYEAGREIAYEYATKKKKENGLTVEVLTDKVKGFDGLLLPKSLLAGYFFDNEMKALDILRGQLDDVSAKLEEMAEEHGGEDDFLGALDDLKKATIAARLKAIKKDAEAGEEREILQAYNSLQEMESTYKKAIKQAETDLDTKLEKRYAKLTIPEIKRLLVEEKWFSAIYAGIDAIHERIWLNLQLAKKPLHCLEYVIVHEMIHFSERKHSDKFREDMDKFLPGWRAVKEELNRQPLDYMDVPLNYESYPPTPKAD